VAPFEQLLEIPGIGKSTAEILYKQNYQTVEDVASAKMEDLVAIPGIGEKKAKKLKESAESALKANEQ
jgi:transcription termination factor NusA